MRKKKETHRTTPTSNGSSWETFREKFGLVAGPDHAWESPTPSKPERAWKVTTNDDGQEIVQDWSALNRSVKPDGYIYVYIPERGPAGEHRLVVEKRLNRRLSPEEHINHIDGDPSNNADDNLEVLSQAQAAKVDARRRGFLAVSLAEKLVADLGLSFAFDRGGKLYVWDEDRGRYVADDDYYEQGLYSRIDFHLFEWEAQRRFAMELRLVKEIRYRLLVSFAEPLWVRLPSTELNLRNGIFDIEDRSLRAQRAYDWRSTVQLGVSYNPAAECPAWEHSQSTSSWN